MEGACFLVVTQGGWMNPTFLNYPVIMVPLTAEPVTMSRTLTYVDSRTTKTFRVRVAIVDRMEIIVCDILAQYLIELIEYSYHQSIYSFLKA
jgi:hypothetical protein